MSSVEIDRVRKSFGGVRVIHDISLEVRSGEFVVLVGPSGCGKSTLLRMIAGLETLSGGEIRIGGRRANNLRPKDRDIAMVFQSYALYPHMTVAANMAFALRMSRLPRNEITERVEKAAEILGLSGLLERRPPQLSGGQRQRVAMGRAMVRDPAVFLFDEPLSNLDAQLRVEVRGEIKALQERLGTTTIYVTHDQIEAMTMADRIVVMNAGNVEQIGAPLEVYDHPASVFVARFIGSPRMNLIEGVVEALDGEPVLRSATGELVRLPAGLVAERGANLILGIRPEHMLLVDTGGYLNARVQRVEQTGSETHITLDIGGQSANIAAYGRLDRVIGEPVEVTFDSENLHLFDKTTGRRAPAGCG